MDSFTTPSKFGPLAVSRSVRVVPKIGFCAGSAKVVFGLVTSGNNPTSLTSRYASRQNKLSRDNFGQTLNFQSTTSPQVYVYLLKAKKPRERSTVHSTKISSALSNNKQQSLFGKNKISFSTTHPPTFE